MSGLYETDFHTWAWQQADMARISPPAALDWQNAAEESESLVDEQARVLASRHCILLLHLLKRQREPERRSRGWRLPIGRERISILDHLEAALPAGLPPAAFPEACPCTLDQTMDEVFWPGNT